MLPKYHSRYFHLKYLLDGLSDVGGTVLDVGCGRGEIAAQLKRNRQELTIFACDNDPEQLAYFKKDHFDKTIKICLCDAQELSYKGQQFDAVVMIYVLEHLEIPSKAISEIKRVLKPNGACHLVVPLEAELTTIDGWVRKIFGKNLKLKPIGHKQQFTLDDILGLFTQNNLSIVRVRYSYHLCYQLFSLIYYLYVNVFNAGEYVPLESEDSRLNRIIHLLTVVGGWVVYLESGILFRVKGQTAHITARLI